MAHGDDFGLKVPPNLAPIQVVVIAVRDEAEVNEAADRVADSLRRAGVRVEVDHARGSFGRRVTDWEIKGVPLRIEVGPRDLAQGLVTVARRDTGKKATVGLGALASEVPALLERIQTDLLASAIALSRRAHARRHLDSPTPSTPRRTGSPGSPGTSSRVRGRPSSTRRR